MLVKHVQHWPRVHSFLSRTQKNQSTRTLQSPLNSDAAFATREPLPKVSSSSSSSSFLFLPFCSQSLIHSFFPFSNLPFSGFPFLSLYLTFFLSCMVSQPSETNNHHLFLSNESWNCHGIMKSYEPFLFLPALGMILNDSKLVS